MANKTPIRAVFNDSNVATGLAEFQSGDTIGLTHGGIGASLSIGSAGQVLKVNSGASALEFGFVEAVVNIDNATNLESVTLATGDKFLISDGGTEGRATLAQVDTLFSGTSKTLTNKTISGSSNTLSNIGNSSLSNSAVTVGSTSISLGASSTTLAGLTSVTSGTVNIADRHIKTTDSTNLVLNEAIDISSAGAITAGSINLSGNAVISGNLTVSGSTTSVETTNSTISDKLIELATGTSGTPSGDSGIIIERGSSNNAFIGFDESADKFIVGTGTFTGSTTGDLTISTGTLVANLQGNVTGNADTATTLANARTIAGQSFDGSAAITIASTDLSNTSAIALLTSSQTLTNKTISGSNNTLSNIGNTSLSNSTVTIADDSSTAVSVPLGGGFTILGGSGITTSLNGSEMTIATDGAVVTETSTDTLTNKTISGSNNTLSNIANSSLSNSTVNFGGVTLALGASDTTPAFDLSDATAYPTSSLTGTITNDQLAGSIAASKLAGSIGNAKLSNSSFTISTDDSSTVSVPLGGGLSVLGGTNISSVISGSEITLNLGTGIDAAKLSGGNVSNTEFDFLNGVSSAIQTQLDTKAATSFAIAQAIALG